jgi:hypothetical protein
MASPWDQFATVSDDEYAGFEQFAAEQGPLPKDQYLAELQRRFDAGEGAEQLSSLIKAQGIDPATANLEQALAARTAGRAVRFTPEAAQVAPETVGQSLYRGVGDLAEGVGDVLGLIGNPLNAGINYLTGANLTTDIGGSMRDLVGAPRPVTDSERYFSAAAEGGASALTGAGAAAGLAKVLPGMAGYVAGQVAATPGRDFAGGVASAVAAEGGGDAGEAVGGQTGRVVGSLAGGLAGGVAGLKLTERLSRLVSRVPAEVAVDATGNLTPEGHEMALRMGVSDEDARQAFARARQGRYGGRGSQENREAIRNRTYQPPEQRAPVERAEVPQRPSDFSAADRNIVDEIGRRLENGQAFDRPDAPPPPPRDVFTEASEERIPLTRGQAEQDFNVQNDENSLRVSSAREGQQARDWYNQQQQAIAGAVDRFRSRFGTDPGNKTDRGEQLQAAVRELRDQGQAGVSALYRAAEELGGEGLTLPTEGIRNAATDVLIDELVPEGVKKAVSQELARYGIIGEAQPTNEVGITRVTLDDGSSVSFRGPVRQLTAANAEDLRKAVNRLYASDPSRASQSIKPAIDDALEEALTTGSQQEGAIGNAYRTARAAHQAQRQRFNAKDIIEDLVASKKGADQTPRLAGEQAIARTIGSGPDGVSNLRRVRTLLLSSNTSTARQAWGAIQHQTLADIFDQAWSRNVNHGSGQIGDVISGAKLNTAIDKFGIDKLRLVLSPEDFNGLMKLRRIIGAATIPITGTTNPSGTFTKIANFLRGAALRGAAVVPGLSTVIDSGGNLLAKARDKAVTRRTLQGITNYTGPDSSRRIDQEARDFLAEYIRSGKSGEFVPTTINLSATQGGGRND